MVIVALILVLFALLYLRAPRIDDHGIAVDAMPERGDRVLVAVGRQEHVGRVVARFTYGGIVDKLSVELADDRVAIVSLDDVRRVIWRAA